MPQLCPPPSHCSAEGLSSAFVSNPDENEPAVEAERTADVGIEMNEVFLRTCSFSKFLKLHIFGIGW